MPHANRGRSRKSLHSDVHTIRETITSPANTRCSFCPSKCFWCHKLWYLHVKPALTRSDQPLNSYKSHQGGSNCEIYNTLKNWVILTRFGGHYYSSTVVIKAGVHRSGCVSLCKIRLTEINGRFLSCSTVTFLTCVQFSMCSTIY